MCSIYQGLMEEIHKHQISLLKTTILKSETNTKIIKELLTLNHEQAAKVLEKGHPIVEEHEDYIEVIEPFYNKERLIVLGGGHIALPLVNFASQVGFKVTVVDDRPSFANTKRFHGADQVICCGFTEIQKYIEMTPYDFVVIITRGHRHDKVCIEEVFKGEEPFYTGMIGSRRRVKALKELLVEEGLDEERLERIHTPIGLSIGAVTPEEIAISIMAEIIACKRLGEKHVTQYTNHSDVDYPVIEHLAKDEELKAIVTIIDAKGSVPRHRGAKMLVYRDGTIVGSIGGGCSESAVMSIARQIIGTGTYVIEEIDMTGEVAEEEGMVCGGWLKVLIEDDIRS